MMNPILMVGALKFALGEMKEGASIAEVCAKVDAEIEAMSAGLYKKTKGLLKGVGFPTAISVNNVLCHFAPLVGDSNDRTLKAGDLAKMYVGYAYGPINAH